MSDICNRLQLDNPEDAEYIVAKAIRCVQHIANHYVMWLQECSTSHGGCHSGKLHVHFDILALVLGWVDAKVLILTLTPYHICCLGGKHGNANPQSLSMCISSYLTGSVLYQMIAVCQKANDVP